MVPKTEMVTARIVFIGVRFNFKSARDAPKRHASFKLKCQAGHNRAWFLLEEARQFDVNLNTEE